MAKYLGVGCASTPRPLGRISVIRSPRRAQWYEEKTHAEDGIPVTRDVHAHGLDGYPTPFVCTPRDIGETPGFDLHGAIETVGDVHGLWDHAMSTTCFAKRIEQFQSFVMRGSIILQTLELVLALDDLARGKAYLIHLTNTPLNFRLRISQKWEGDKMREEFSALP